MLLLANFFVMLTWQGDYIILGIMHDPKTVGIYFFAFNLSIQTMQVFTSNLDGRDVPGTLQAPGRPAPPDPGLFPGGGDARGGRRAAVPATGRPGRADDVDRSSIPGGTRRSACSSS